MRFLFIVMLLFVISCSKKYECIDIDDNIYQTVKIGKQVWMAENLKVTHYRDGKPIPTGYSNLAWIDLDKTKTGAYAVYPESYDDVSISTCNNDCSEVYGNLYNWYAVGSEKLCPEGWHIPSDEEWVELEIMLGVNINEIRNGKYYFRGTNQGSQLAGNLYLWTSKYPADSLVSNTNFGTSGFNVLPGGMLDTFPLFFKDVFPFKGREASAKYFTLMGSNATFWTSTVSSNFPGMSARTRSVQNDSPKIWWRRVKKTYGYSVRCIAD